MPRLRSATEDGAAWLGWHIGGYSEIVLLGAMIFVAAMLLIHVIERENK